MTLSFRLPLAAAAVLTVAGASLASAQAVTATDRTFSFVRYGTEHGLPSERVLSVAQDSVGFIWVGTADGVARFDGVSARVWRHQPRSTVGLPSSAVGDITVGGDGTVWVSTDGGVARFDRQSGRFERFAEDEFRRVVGVSVVPSLSADKDGLWAAIQGGVARIRFDGSVSRIDAVGVPDLKSPRPGETWLAHETCRLLDHPVRCETPRQMPRPVGTAAVWADGEATFGVFNDGSVWRLSPSPAAVDEWNGFRSLALSVNTIVELPTVWVAAPGGLFVYDTDLRSASQIGVVNGVIAQDTRDVMIDRQGGIWVATDRGLYRGVRPDPAFEAVTAAAGLPDGRVNGLLQTPDGSTWVGTNGGLYRRRADGRWDSFFSGPNAYANGVWQVARARGGGLWVGGKAFGLRRLWPETGRWEQVTELNRRLGLGGVASSRFPVRSILEADGRLWIGSSSGLAVRLRDESWRVYQKGDGGRDGLPTDAVNVVHVDDEGRTWVGTDGGLVEFDLERRSFRRVAPSSLGASIVWDVEETPDDPGALWLATVGTGMCRLDPEADRVECFTTADGLPSNVVHRIERGDGALWLGTDRGVSRFDLEAGSVATYTKADGLHGDIADFMSSYRTTDGTLMFGGPGGYTVFGPSEVTERGAPPVVQFTSVSTGGVELPPVATGDTISLDPRDRRLAAEFAALDFTAPGQNRYRHRLLPVDSMWTPASARSAEVRYPALPPGEYVLEVLGSSHTGTFGDTPARLYISVPPMWWERTSVRALGLVLAVGLMGALGWTGVRRSERKRADALEVARRLAEVREAERLRLARELHDGTMQHIYRAGHDLDRLAETAGLEAVSVARAGLDEAATDLRAVLTDIRPPHVGTLGAGPAIQAAATQFGRTYPDLEVETDLEATGRRWPIPVQHAAVRIAQEALSNAGRHAAARHVVISLTERDGAGVLEVADDGTGFDIHLREVDHVRDGHFGLAGLRERAEALGGHLEIESAPGQGTTIRARLPLKEEPRRRRFL